MNVGPRLTRRRFEPAPWRTFAATAVAMMLWTGWWARGPLAAQALELRFAPRATIFALEDRRQGAEYYGLLRYYNVMLQNVAVLNHGPGAVTVAEGSIEVLRAGRIVQSQDISGAEIEHYLGVIASFEQQGVQAVTAMSFGTTSLLRESTAIAASPLLAPGRALIVSNFYVTVRGLPDSIRVTFKARRENGVVVEVSDHLAVALYQQKNNYVFPLEHGDWFVRGYPGIRSHHRWNWTTEYAYDITIVDGWGELHTGDGRSWSDWYAYGKPVLAAADGRVHTVLADQVQVLGEVMRREGETAAEHNRRVTSPKLLQLIETGTPFAGYVGNYVVIEHEGGEYSSYFHLAHGSILVEPGDRVVQGQHIADVGGTGEWYIPHLHFQLNDGPDLMNSASLPVTFRNTRYKDFFSELNPEHLEPGFFVHVDRIRTAAR